MTQFKRIKDLLVIEPLSWLFYYFFQPGHFYRKSLELEGVLKRLLLAVRLALPLFLCCFWLSLAVRMILYASFPQLYALFFPPNFFVLTPPVLQFWLDTFFVTLLCTVISIALAMIFGFQVGTTTSIAMTLASSICIQANSDIMVALTFGLILGLLSGLTFINTKTVTRGTVRGMLVVVILSIVCGSIVGILGGFSGGVALGVIDGPALAAGILGSVCGGVLGGIVSASVTRLLIIAIKSIAQPYIQIEEESIRLSVTLSGTFGAVVGIATGDAALQIASSRSVHMSDFIASINIGSSLSVIVGLSFLIAYGIGYYRLPLYPAIAFSLLRAYRASRKDPVHMFFYLQRSALHWDERVLLPLVYLQAYLRFALQQGKYLEQVLDEVTFIVTERPTQIGVAKSIILEIVLHLLERCSSLLDIYTFSARFATIIPPAIALLAPTDMLPFTQLQLASANVARYYSPLTWEMKAEALQTARRHLQMASTTSALTDRQLRTRLEAVIEAWQEIVQRAMVELEQMHDMIALMSNPFIAGISITPDRQCFVGRRDLARRLRETLESTQHPAIVFIHGERHMGKSSFLLNLAPLLGARYIPVTYDMQRAANRSTTILLSNLAAEIRKVVIERRMYVKELRYIDLQEASERDEAGVYRMFDRWLMQLERTVARANKILLLTFDEFEAFEARSDTKLLLPYLRSVVGRSPHTALLFCGLTPFTELPTTWKECFPQPFTFKMSFLQGEDAQQLIQQLTPLSPSGPVFSAPVIEQILRESACNPFYLQGICSSLIEHLNSQERFATRSADVSIAVEEFLDKWWHEYFSDLWQRTTLEQRQCLHALSKVGQGDEQTIGHASGLDGNALPQVLNILQKRDLIIQEQTHYRLAAPILHKWLIRGEQNDEKVA